MEWCTQYLNIDEDGYFLAEAIRQHDAIAVSNGSFKDTYATSSMGFIRYEFPIKAVG